MPWNPPPKVADCRDLAKKWKKEQVIVISLDDTGRIETVTYGKTKQLCACAKALGDVAYNTIVARIDALARAIETGAFEEP